MADTTPNARVICDVLTFLEAHPELHDQGSWVARRECGTVACAAGWTCLLNGYVDVHDSDLWFRGVRLPDAPAGQFEHPMDVAQRLMGIDCPHDAWRLFDEGNDIQDLWRIADELTGGAVSALMSGSGEVSA